MPDKKKMTDKASRKTKKQRVRPLPLVTTTGPPAVREVLAYHYVNVLTEATPAGGAMYTFRLNSIYDPDFSGIGSTAIGYTTKANFYGRYKVMRVRYCVRFWASNTGHSDVGTLVGANSTIASNPNSWAVEPNATVKFVYGNTGGQHSEVVIDRTVDLPRVLGVTRAQYENDSAYGAVFGTNPSLNAFMNLWMVGRAGTAQTVGYDVRIAYDVEFSQPLQSIST